MYEIMWKSTAQPDWPEMAVYYSTCTLHGGWVRLQTHTQNMYYLLLFHSSNGYVSVP